MAIRSVVTRGYGNGTYNGTIALISTRGYAIGEATAAVVVAGKPARRRRVILPDGRRVELTDDELSFLRAEYEARARQEGQATTKEKRRIKSRGQRRAKTRTFETPAEIAVSGAEPIPIPRSLIPEDRPEDVDVNAAILRKIAEIREQEDEAALLLLLVS